MTDSRRIPRGFSRPLAVLGAILFLGSTSTLLMAQGTVRVLGSGTADDPPQIRLEHAGDTGLTLEFTLPAVTAEDVDHGGEAYQRLAIPGGGLAGSAGAPALPTFSRFVAVPEGAEAIVTIASMEEDAEEGYRIAPTQESDDAEFVVDPQAYARSGFGTDPVARMEPAASWRGLRVAPLTFAPVRYDPTTGQLRIVRHARVEISFTGGSAGRKSLAPSRPVPDSFDRLYRALVVNYPARSASDAAIHGTWLLICPNNADVVSHLQPLVDWRRRQGYPVYLATTAETGTTNTAIKAFIQNAYDTWTAPPEFIVLAGDANGTYAIPTFYETVSGYNGEGDHPYTQLEGNDILADAHVGRLSFSTLTELDTIVNKIVGYESTPYLTDTNWFTRACLVGDPYNSSGRSTVMLQQWVKTRLLQLGYTQVDTIFTDPFVSQMTTALNRGDTIFCYRGIGGFSGWSNSNTNALTNINKLFFSVTCTCSTGSFANGTSNNEAFLRAGSPTSPRAGVGAIATATNGTHTRYNNCFTYGVMQGLLYEDDWEMGAAHSRGKYELYLDYQAGDPNAVIRFSYWNNLMGDPACRVWSAVPRLITSDVPASIPTGSNCLTVRVSEPGGAPCDSAQVCLLADGSSAQVGVTNAQGDCELPVNAVSGGTIRLTVTRHNCRPILTDIAVTDSDLFLASVSSVVDDDGLGGSAGNGDGVVNPGETIELGVLVHNFGVQAAGGVTAVLASSSPYVTMLQAQGSYGTVGAGGSATSVTPFRFRVQSGCPDGEPLRFSLTISSGAYQWHSLVTLEPSAAVLEAVSTTLYNSGNGILDPGETLQMSVGVQNRGGIDAAGTIGTLTSLSPWVTVVDGSGDFGSIAAGGQGENIIDRFSVRAASGTFPGHLAAFRLVTVCNSGVLDTTYTSLTVGVCSSDDPVGPDGHGYYAYDNTDVAYPLAPTYAWEEISPLAGGDGTLVPLGDYGEYQDKSTAMNLPFPFQFYGQDFTRVTICSNGWLAMGDTYLVDYRNWNIPGAGAPQNLIAVFWDDLYEVNGIGRVYQKYDSISHRWIVEWYHLRNAHSPSVYETFEAILYDPAYWVTPGGDGRIRMQYYQISNVDTEDMYATVGIQNWSHTDGLLYTYYNRYPTGAASLTAGRAIEFYPGTTDAADVPESSFRPAAGFFLSPARPNPSASSTALTFSLEAEGTARVSIYDIEGRVVRRLLNRRCPAGPTTVTWNGTDGQGRPAAAGVYFVRLDAGERQMVRRLIRLE